MKAEFIVMSKEQAKEAILDYIRSNPGCLTSDIICNLLIHPMIVGEALDDLETDKKVTGKLAGAED